MTQIRFDSRRMAIGALASVGAVLWVALFGTMLSADQVPESVVEVRIEGNETIQADWILQKIKTQPGRQLTGRMILEDERTLRQTRLFSHVQSRYENTKRGAVLIFKVRERAIVRSVRFLGNKKVKTKHLVSWTGLAEGSPFDHRANEQAASRIEQEYKEKGYYHVRVKLRKGGHPDDRDVVIEIEEGPVVRVIRRDIMGAVQIGKGSLKKNLVTKSAILGMIKGIYRPETLKQDEEALKSYCQRIGYFDAQVEAEALFSKDGSSVRAVYTIKEGPRYKVGQIRYEDNHLFSGKTLQKDARIREGDFFNSGRLTKDVREMLAPYWDRGHYYASIVPVPLFTEKTGVVDLVFRFDEDRPRYVRDINAEFSGDSPYTKQTVLLNNLQIRPGDLADPRLIRRGQSRANSSQVFNGVQVQVVRVDPETDMFTAADGTYRGQQPVPGTGPHASWLEEFASRIDQLPGLDCEDGHSAFTVPKKPSPVPPQLRSPAVNIKPTVRTPDPDLPNMSQRVNQQVPASIISWRPVEPDFFHRPWAGLLTQDITLPATPTVVRAQGPGRQQLQGPGRGNSVLEGSPFYGEAQAQPPGYVDINAMGTEGRTGRIMFGAGVNSDNGLVGSFVWEENNFDLFAPPRNFSDVVNGRAFRGGGQRFRAEAAPGDIVSRYAVNWVDQYFMQTDYALSLSGFYYNRFFNDWQEDRLGGRVGLGQQLSPESSVNATLRLEEVTVKNPRVPTPSILANAVGSNFLSTIRLSATNDTRDASIMPGDGHFMEVAFEQAAGDYMFSRFDGEARRYFTLFRRPDDSGRQVLTLSTTLGFTTADTPIFERYYAGGFQSFRGFAFRGVSPQDGVVGIGGTFQTLSTVEYRLPVTADDVVQVVGFTDFGTVDNEVSFRSFRATVGMGLRITVPAMGQVPLAFDFGFPVAKEVFDDERIFSFYVGIVQ
ncbi:MAG: BamA/TamA family outer membrane protein [Fuerstiella sp.]|nr:BamA/TamA family outer membrane protein [Fuerstiella sp.]